MDRSKQLVKNSTIYFLGHLLAMVPGLISMPIMTRILEKEEYGTMVLINVTISLIGLIAGFGIQDAVMRFYSAYKEDPTKSGQIGRFRNTSLTFFITLNGTAALFLISVTYTAQLFIAPGPVMIYLRIAAVLVLLRSALDIYLAFYREEGKASHFCLVIISQQYLAIFFAVIFAIYFFKGILGVYLGMFLGEGLVVLLFLFLLFREKQVTQPEWDSTIIRSLIQYGAPLLISNVALLVMNMGDRYIIQYYLNAEAVANYSIPYQLILYVETMLFGPIRNAFVPYLFSLYEQKGVEAVGKSVSLVIEFVLVLTIPAAFGLAYLGPDIIIILATQKYVAAASLMWVVILGLFSFGIYHAILSNIPLLFKRTRLISGLTCIGAITNLLLNILLIPFLGLWGAAIATAVSYLFISGYTFFVVRASVPIRIRGMIVVKSVLFSATMLITIEAMGKTSSLLLTIIAKLIVGALIYGLLQFTFNGDLRNFVYTFLKKKTLKESL
ncbi:MAG: oligosaccharide flippase family protein [Nitrospirota bacterium]